MPGNVRTKWNMVSAPMSKMMLTISARHAMRPANSIVKQHANQRDGQPDQTGENAGANRIRTKRWRDAAFFFDAYWRLQRILQHAGQTARFFFAEMSSDDGVATVNRIANHRRGLNNAIEHDGETMTFVLLGDLAEFFRAFAVEFQLDRPAFIAVIGMRFGHAIAAKVGFLFHQQTFVVAFSFHPRQRACSSRFCIPAE